jgi:hypothetical protein
MDAPDRSWLNIAYSFGYCEQMDVIAAKVPARCNGYLACLRRVLVSDEFCEHPSPRFGLETPVDVELAVVTGWVAEGTSRRKVSGADRFAELEICFLRDRTCLL